ncbi:MAG: TetR/AcrR family transcriptional regulator [Myxococcaceae bacterium]
MAEELPDLLKKARAQVYKRSVEETEPPRGKSIDGDQFAPAKKSSRPNPLLTGAAPPPMTPTTPAWRGEATPGSAKDLLLSAAVELFARSGFRNVTVDEIASKAGVPKAEVHKHALNKEDLFHQAVAYEVERFIELSRTWLDKKMSAKELFGVLAAKSGSYLETKPLLLQLMLGICADQLPSWGERFQILRERTTDTIVDAIKQGIAQGVFRGDLSAQAVAMVLLDLHISGFVSNPSGPERVARVQQRRAVALEMIFNGLLAR